MTGEGKANGKWHRFRLTSSILHPFGLLQEQMVVAECRFPFGLCEGDLEPVHLEMKGDWSLHFMSNSQSTGEDHTAAETSSGRLHLLPFLHVYRTPRSAEHNSVSNPLRFQMWDTDRQIFTLFMITQSERLARGRGTSCNAQNIKGGMEMTHLFTRAHFPDSSWT